MAPNLLRYPCMIFGLATIASCIAHARAHDLFMLVGGLLVGGAWFAFGMYGGLPLVGTVDDWHPPADSTAIEDMHRRGLLVMRRRKWLTWLAAPGALVVGVSLMPLLRQVGQPQLVVLLMLGPLAFVNYRYYLSRCPRCGYGFFTRSTNRAALLRRGKACGHCGLSLLAFKET